MKKARKLALLGACLVSSFGLVGCSGEGKSLGEGGKAAVQEASRHMDKGWIIAEIGKKDVLFDSYDIYYGYDILYNYGSGIRGGIGSGSVVFKTAVDDKTHVASDFFIFDYDVKPTIELYDVEYGTKEWNDMYVNIAENSVENSL